MAKQTRKLWVSFVVLASLLLLSAVVSAAPSIANTESVKVNGVEVYGMASDIAVFGGETIGLTVVFEALDDASDLRMEATVEGEKVDVEEEVFVGDVENGKRYIQSLTLDMPYELKDEKSDELALNIKIWNGEFRTNLNEITLSVQREAYNVEVVSASTSDSIKAGALFPVDVVLRNTGYNNLDDLYVTVAVPALELEKTAYFGDLVALETDDDEDTTDGRIFLQMPYYVVPGEYTLEVQIENDDFKDSVVKQITVENDFPNNVVASDSEMASAVGQTAEYDLIVVNPTNNIKVYRIVPETLGDLEATSSQSIVSVPADSSRTVAVSAKAGSSGQHDFSVNVFSGETLTGRVDLTLRAQDGVSSPVVVLTIILAVVFVVLLGVLVVLITKKPKKQEEFGESYY